MITPSVGGHHDQPFAILEVDKSTGTRFTAFSPCGRQEQGLGTSDDPRTDQSARVTVDELMELEIGTLQRGRGGVAHESHSLCQCPAVTRIIVSRTSLSAITFRRPWRRTIGAPCSVPDVCLRLHAGDGASSASIRVALQGMPVKATSWLSGVDAACTDRGRAGAPGGGTGGTPRGRSPASDAPPCGS
jgi:hypothetical protein